MASLGGPFHTCRVSVELLYGVAVEVLFHTVCSAAELQDIHQFSFYFQPSEGIFCLVLFSLGVGMLLATSMVFFCSIQFLWGVLTMI